MTIPISVAANVPKGIDTFGFFKSPDNPTPAVIPVNAGNTIAKMKKKSLLAQILLFN